MAYKICTRVEIIWSLSNAYAFPKRKTRPDYGDFSFQFYFSVWVFSCFTHFSVAPFAFAADQTECRLN